MANEVAALVERFSVGVPTLQVAASVVDLKAAAALTDPTDEVSASVSEDLVSHVQKDGEWTSPLTVGRSRPSARAALEMIRHDACQPGAHPTSL